MMLAERTAKLKETARKWNGFMPQDRPTELTMYKALRDALAIIEELKEQINSLERVPVEQMEEVVASAATIWDEWEDLRSRPAMQVLGEELKILRAAIATCEERP